MEFAQKLTALEESAQRHLEVLDTEEKTKNALLLPFFDLLGYDPFDVQEVEPGYAVDLDGEGQIETDYAVHLDGAPVMLFQCEEAAVGQNAFEGHSLFRHLDEVEASIVGLTNGLSYWFYTEVATMGGTNDLPFLKFDLLDYEPDQVTDLKRLAKSNFDAEEIFSIAFERQHTQLLQGYLARQREDPDEHFVRFLAAQVHEGGVSEDVLDRLQPVVRSVLQDTASDPDADLLPETPDGPPASAGDPEGQTTEIPVLDSGDEGDPPNGTADASEAPSGEAETEDTEDGEASPEDPEEDTEQKTNIGQEFARRVIGE